MRITNSSNGKIKKACIPLNPAGCKLKANSRANENKPFLFYHILRNEVKTK